MNNDTIFQLMECAITAVGIVISGVLIPFIVNKIGADNLKRYIEWGRIAVEASEKMFESYSGRDKSEVKKAYATKLLKDISKNKLTDNQINALLESSIYKMGINIDNTINNLTNKEK